MKPKEYKGKDEDVERPISEDEMNQVSAAEPVRPRLDLCNMVGDAWDEKQEPCYSKPRKVSKECLRLVCELAVFVSARTILMLLNRRPNDEQEIQDPRCRETQNNSRQCFEAWRVAHSVVGDIAFLSSGGQTSGPKRIH